MPDFTEAEMMADLARADAAGDTALAQHIADRIKSGRVGGMETFGRGAVQGATLGFGDEIGGSADAAARKNVSGRLGLKAPDASYGDLYRDARDKRRGENDAAKAAHPGAYLAGNITGGVAPALLTGGGSKAMTLGQKLLSALKTGMAYGGVAGLGGSSADLTKGDVGGAAVDTGVGAAAGGGLGVGATLLGAAARPVAGKLKDMSIETGRRFLSGTQSSLSQKAALPAEAVEEAFQQKAITPFSTVKTASEKLDVARETVGQQYADIVAQLEAKGVSGPHARQLAMDLMAESDAISSRTLGSPRPGVFRGIAEELPDKPTDAAGNLGLTQAESMKRELQHMARSEYDKLQNLQTPKGEAQEAVASRLREAIEGSVDAQRAKAPAEAAAFQPVKEQLSRLIPASNAARAGANRAEKNHAIGLKELLIGMGSPLKTAAAVVGKTRGSSTVASGLRAGSNAVDFLSPSANPNSTQALLAAMLRQLALRESQERAAQ